MREAPGGPWRTSTRIVEQMEKDGFRFRSSDLKAQRVFLRSIIMGEGAGIFAVTGTKKATKYALVEVVGEKPGGSSQAVGRAPLTKAKASPRQKVKKVRMDRKGTAQVMCRQDQGSPSVLWLIAGYIRVHVFCSVLILVGICIM